MMYKEYGSKLKPDVSTRIINWNTHELLEQCLTSIIQNTDDVSYEMIVVDNNSAGTGFKKVKEKFSGYKFITWIENDENRGGLVDDQTLPYCRGRYLLILGPDTIVPPRCIRNMVDFLDANKEAGAVTAKLLNPDGSPQNYYYKFWNLPMVFFSTAVGGLLDNVLFKSRFKRYYFGGDIDPDKITVIEQPAGGCLMLRWDPPVVDYITAEDFPFYFGDTDLCKRVYKAGYKIFLLPSAQVTHFQSSSFKKADNAWKAREYSASIIKYFKKYHKHQVVLLKVLLLLDEAMKRIYRKLFPSWVEYLKKELADSTTVLDLGCGRDSPLQYCNVPFSVGVELFTPYLDESKSKAIHNEYIKADIRKIELKPKCFDAVIAIEVLEHLTREEGHALIKRMETWARKKVIVTTPNGYLWQDGYHGNPLQEHRSGWGVEDLRKAGFRVCGLNGWKKLRGYQGNVKYEPTVLWERFSDLSQKITRRWPSQAFQFLAIREIKLSDKE